MRGAWEGGLFSPTAEFGLGGPAGRPAEVGGPRGDEGVGADFSDWGALVGAEFVFPPYQGERGGVVDRGDSTH